MLIGLRFYLRYLKFIVGLGLTLATASAWSQGPGVAPTTPNSSTSGSMSDLLNAPQPASQPNPPTHSQPSPQPSPQPSAQSSNQSATQSGAQQPPPKHAAHPLGAAPVPEIEADPASRLEIFGGYSFLYLKANINNEYKYSEWDGGPITSGSYWFNKRYGVQAEGAIHEQTPTSCYSTAQAGPVVRFFTSNNFSPYVHLDAGTTRLGIRNIQGCAFNFGATAGAGLDYVIPETGNRLAIRIFQADYDYARLKYTVTNGIAPNNITTSGSTNVDVPRISSGLVLRLGNFEHASSKSIDCHTDPSTALAGEKIVLAAYAHGYVFGAKYQIHWSSNAGKVVYPGPDVLLDTTGVEPGVYEATAQVTRGKDKKPLLQCTAAFAVKAPPAPTITCSAEPSSVTQADVATITAVGNSSADRQLYYSFNTTAGQIVRDHNVARLQTATARPGVIDVICRVQDDLGQIAEATTHVTVVEAPVSARAPEEVLPAPMAPPVVEALVSPPARPPAPPPPPPPAPPVQAPPPPPVQAPPPPPPVETPSEAPSVGHADKMCSLAFDRDLNHPTRLDKAAMDCLDELAAKLHAVPGSRVTLIGNHGAEEEDGPKHAAERTFNAQSYLVNDKFVDASRIDIRTGSSTNRSVEIYFLPQGMHFDPPPTEQNHEY